MWRSVARRVSFSRHAAALQFRSVQNPPLLQVTHRQTLIFVQYLFHLHFSTRVSQKSSYFPITRFFSHDSFDPTHDLVVESHIESTTPETNEDRVFVDANNMFEENPSSISADFEKETVSSSSSSIFEEASNNLTMDEFASGIDESVAVEDEKMKEEVEVDLEKLESLLSLLQSSNIFEGSLESSLEHMGLTLHEEFIVRVLETPFVPGENLIGFFKWVSKKPEFSVSSKAMDALVRAICSELRKKDAYALWDLMKEVGEKENAALNTEILNELISLFSRLGKGKAGLEVFNKFGEFGCVPNADTYYFAIEALCRRSIFEWACSVCEKMLNADKLPDSEKIGKIISYMCKGGKAKDAHLIFLSAKEKQRYPPRSSVNFLISSLCRDDETVHLALDMLEEFQEDDRKYAIKQFSAVISGLCRIKDVEGAKKVLFKMIDLGPPPGNSVFNMIINALSKAGYMEDTTKLLQVMEDRGLKPDLYTYNVIMSGYVKGGEMEEACKVLAEAKKKHPKLGPMTYHTLIRGYCKLEHFDMALKLLREMEEYGVQPSFDEYNKLIQSLCLKAVDWGMAEKLLEEMKEKGLHLNGITKGLIRAVKELEEEGMETEEASVEA
ncbi:unnamed protein product [Ilex paraguariensis]|uniref:Pentatricopeptide repeat-containing protein n=1 Tax=Ilex paraguariensis TaxID=185542 RepID=A0ABC8T409_9AQUA